MFTTPERKRIRHKEYMRTVWYPKNRAKHIALVKKNKHNRKLEAIEAIKKGVSCSRCPEDHPSTIDFHHLDPSTKEFNVSTAIIQNMSLDRIKKEVDKCIPLCANCHRKEHRP